MTNPSPRAPPASPVPAPRGVTVTPACAAASISAQTWRVLAGNATASGVIW